MYHLGNKKEQIVKLYGEKKSIRAIASILNCSPSGIKQILNKYNVPVRNKCESLNLCPETFTQEEKNLVIGSILGNGNLTKPAGKNAESCLTIGHSIKQKEYIQFKYRLLQNWIGCNIYSLFNKLNNGETYETLNFVTRRNKNFTELRNAFYVNGKKVLPTKFIEENINPQVLAIWFMDNGYNVFNKGCEFCSESFSKEENIELIKILKEKFDIHSQLKRIRSKQYRIYIAKKEKSKLFDLIKNNLDRSMKYKVESSETIRQTPKGEDIVRTSQKCEEVCAEHTRLQSSLKDQRYTSNTFVYIVDRA